MKKKLGILLIHGLGGDFDEVAPLHKCLMEAGYKVQFVQLAGHTSKRMDMWKTSCDDWLKSVQVAYNEMQNEVESVGIVGFSLGGLLGVNIAEQHPLAFLITLNMPVYYWNFKQIYQNLKNDLDTQRYDNTVRYTKAMFKFPLRALYEFKRFLVHTKRKMKHFKYPLFILQTIDDDTVPKESAHYIFKHTSSTSRQIKYYSRGGHVMLWGPENKKICTDIVHFIENRFTCDTDE